MHFSTTASLALTFALVAATPQGLPAGIADLPDCALNGLPQALAASGCPGIDPACLCSKPDLAAQLTPAVDAACTDAADREKLKTFIAGFCPSSSAAASSPAMTEAPTATSEMMSVEASTTSWTSTTCVSNGTWTTGSATNGTNSTMPTYTTPQPSAETTEAPASTGAASAFGASMMAFAVAMGGMTWAFAEL